MFSLDSVSPTTVGAPGGERIVVVGDFGAELDTEFTVHVGPLGSAADPTCWGGRPGGGAVVRPLTATLLEAYLPDLARTVGAAYSVTVRKADGSEVRVLASQITVLPPSYWTSVFGIRNLFPPHYRVGPRSFETLPEVSP